MNQLRKTALSLVLAADTLSILMTEIIDNAVMVIIPGAMEAGLANWIFWATLPLALAAAFAAAFPVNLYLLKHGRGHALLYDHRNRDNHNH